MITGIFLSNPVLLFEGVTGRNQSKDSQSHSTFLHTLFSADFVVMVIVTYLGVAAHALSGPRLKRGPYLIAKNFFFFHL